MRRYLKTNSQPIAGNSSAPKKLVYLSIDRDIGQVSIEVSNSDRKIEPAPIGHYVHFCKMSEAKRLKQKFDRKPYLLEKFLNS